MQYNYKVIVHKIAPYMSIYLTGLETEAKTLEKCIGYIGIFLEDKRVIDNCNIFLLENV